MADPTSYPSRLRVALLEPEPIRVQGFITLFQDHPRIEFVVFELPAFLADQEFKLALIGLHGDKLPLPLVGTIHGLRPDVRLIVMGPNADDEVILQAISSGAKAYLEANATPATGRTGDRDCEPGVYLGAAKGVVDFCGSGDQTFKVRRPQSQLTSQLAKPRCSSCWSPPGPIGRSPAPWASKREP